MPDSASKNSDTSQSYPTVYETEEHGTVPVPLSLLLRDDRLELHEGIIGSDYFKIYSRKDQLVFQAGGVVGHVAVNPQVILDIRPRADVGRNLERVLLTAKHSPKRLDRHQRHYGVYAIPNPTLLDILTEAFLSAVQDVAAQGLHREYRLAQHDTSFPRGRILVGETMQRHFARGVRHVAKAAWYEQTIDTGINRCLKYTLWSLANRYQKIHAERPEVKKLLLDLNGAYRRFDGIELDHHLQFLSDLAVVDPSRLPAMRFYYQNALSLATLIIRDASISFRGDGGTLLLPSLLIDMDKVFEDYLRTVLRIRLMDRSSRYDILDGTKGEPVGAGKPLFDQSVSVPARPDIVIRDTTPGDDDPSNPIIIDAKYKPMSGFPDRSDVNQVIAYAVSYRAPIAIIGHPWKAGFFHGLRSVGRIDELQVYQYAFNLGADDLDSEEKAFAAVLRQILP